jgi:hypothetical protein
MTVRSMSAVVHFLLLNGFVNKRTTDAGFVAPCIYMECGHLVDCHRSPVFVLFEKQSGSPVRIRTSDPFVYSPGVKCFVFSGNV